MLVYPTLTKKKTTKKKRHLILWRVKPKHKLRSGFQLLHDIFRRTEENILRQQILVIIVTFDIFSKRPPPPSLPEAAVFTPAVTLYPLF